MSRMGLARWRLRKMSALVILLRAPNGVADETHARAGRKERGRRGAPTVSAGLCASVDGRGGAGRGPRVPGQWRGGAGRVAVRSGAVGLCVPVGGGVVQGAGLGSLGAEPHGRACRRAGPHGGAGCPRVERCAGRPGRLGWSRRVAARVVGQRRLGWWGCRRKSRAGREAGVVCRSCGSGDGRGVRVRSGTGRDGRWCESRAGDRWWWICRATPGGADDDGRAPVGNPAGGR